MACLPILLLCCQLCYFMEDQIVLLRNIYNAHSFKGDILIETSQKCTLDIQYLEFRTDIGDWQPIP